MPRGIKRKDDEKNVLVERVPGDLYIEMKIYCSLKNIPLRVGIITAMHEMVTGHREEIENFLAKIRKGKLDETD